jgi:hypothetical protein
MVLKKICLEIDRNQIKKIKKEWFPQRQLNLLDQDYMINILFNKSKKKD